MRETVTETAETEEGGSPREEGRRGSENASPRKSHLTSV